MTQPTTLTEGCGPHCGTKDGHTAHCDICHRIKEAYLENLARHRALAADAP